MKLSIQVAGVDVTNYTEASIVYDAKYSSTATFTTRQATDGTGWYSNLSKVVISGRELQTENAAWGFEETNDFHGWFVRNGGTVTALDSGAQEVRHSAHGQASLRLTVPVGETHDLFRAETDFNMNGLSFWAWFDVLEQLPFVFVTPYATDGTSTWTGTRTQARKSPEWNAIGLRPASTPVTPAFPLHVTEWGFHIEAQSGDATVFMDSVDLCGRSYPEGLFLPPFAACGTVLGSFSCLAAYPCQNWDGFTWANQAHITATDTGWCPTSATWNQFVWADDRYPANTDAGWT